MKFIKIILILILSSIYVSCTKNDINSKKGNLKMKNDQKLITFNLTNNKFLLVVKIINNTDYYLSYGVGFKVEDSKHNIISPITKYVFSVKSDRTPTSTKGLKPNEKVIIKDYHIKEFEEELYVLDIRDKRYKLKRNSIYFISAVASIYLDSKIYSYESNKIKIKI